MYIRTCLYFKKIGLHMASKDIQAASRRNKGMKFDLESSLELDAVRTDWAYVH